MYLGAKGLKMASCKKFGLLVVKILQSSRFGPPDFDNKQTQRDLCENQYSYFGRWLIFGILKTEVFRVWTRFCQQGTVFLPG
jgi:hypothetical protein